MMDFYQSALSFKVTLAATTIMLFFCAICRLLTEF